MFPANDACAEVMAFLRLKLTLTEIQDACVADR